MIQFTQNTLRFHWGQVHLSIGPQPGEYCCCYKGICTPMHPSSVHQGEERCCQPVAQKVQGAPMLLGSRDKQRPARCAGLARTTGGHDISGSRSGVGQTLPLRADGATTNDCALKMRATPSLRPTPPASGEIKSTNGGLHSCQSVFAVGRAVACPGIGSPCISGVPQRAEFCCRMARTDGYARADAW